MPVYKRPKAEEDLINLWCYLAANTDPAFASRYLGEIEVELEKLAEFPGMGRARSDLYPELRGFPFDELVLFYLPRRDGIDLIRVIAGRRHLKGSRHRTGRIARFAARAVNTPTRRLCWPGWLASLGAA